jgi:hypothetical protein
MFKTSKQHFHDDPLKRVNYSDFIPLVEEKRNKKNDSVINMAHRIDLRILSSIKDGYQRKRGGSNMEIPKDQIFTLG